MGLHRYVVILSAVLLWPGSLVAESIGDLFPNVKPSDTVSVRPPGTATPVPPPAPPAPLPNPVPIPVAPATTPASAPASQPATQTQPAERLPAPDAAKQTAVLKDLQEVFQKEYAEKRPEARVEFAERLVILARGSKKEPADRYVAWREAVRMAGLGGDIPLAMMCLDEIDKAFVGDTETLRVEALDAALASHGRPDVGTSAALQFANLAAAAAKREDFTGALRLIGKAANAARESHEQALVAEMAKVQTDITRLQTECLRAAAARKNLDGPTAPAANATVGRYLCFNRGEWVEGVEYLKKGDDPALRALAEEEAAKPADAAARKTLADHWYDWAEKQTDASAQRGGRQRAAALYRQALPELPLLARQKAETRIGKVDAEYAEQPTFVDLIALLNGTLAHGWTRDYGRLIARRVVPPGPVPAVVPGPADMTLPVTMPPDYEIALQFTAQDASHLHIVVPVGEKYLKVSLACAGPATGITLWAVKGVHHTGIKPLLPAEKTAVAATLKDGKPHVLVAAVSATGDRGHVLVKLDGRDVATWEGPLADIGLLVPMPTPALLILGAGPDKGEVTVQRLMVHVLRGELKTK